MTTDELYPAGRLGQVREATAAAGLDAVLLTPGPDLRYVIGYDAKQLERLTCLAIPAQGGPVLFVPRLELAAAQASPAGALSLEVVPWDRADDPFALVAARLGPWPRSAVRPDVGLSVLGSATRLPGPPGPGRRAAGLRISRPRPRWRPSGRRVPPSTEYAPVPGWLRPGLTSGLGDHRGDLAAGTPPWTS